jgi:hypothetical protein
LIVHRDIGLPAVSVAFNVDPVSARQIIVKEINRYICSPRLLKSRHAENNRG